jgi:hypothetical protein
MTITKGICIDPKEDMIGYIRQKYRVPQDHAVLVKQGFVANDLPRRAKAKAAKPRRPNWPLPSAISGKWHPGWRRKRRPSCTSALTRRKRKSAAC